MKICIVTQARIGSTRFPQKVLKPILGTTLLGLHLQRLKKSKLADKLFVATTFENGVEQITDIATQYDVAYFQGSTSDVLERFYQTVKDYNPDYVVRVTSDCPLIDPQLVDAVIKFTVDHDVDYCSNGFVENFPDGQDVEVFKFSALEKAWQNATLLSEREHVTPYIRNNSDYKGGNLFIAMNYPCESDFSKIRMTVDEPRDFELIEILLNNLGADSSWLAYTNYIIANDLGKINDQIIRNEGLLKSLKNDN